MYKYFLVPTILMFRKFKEEIQRIPFKFIFVTSFILFSYIGYLIYGPSSEIKNITIIRLILQIFIIIITLQRKMEKRHDVFLKISTLNIVEYKLHKYIVNIQYKLFFLLFLLLILFPVYKTYRIENYFLFDSIISFMVIVVSNYISIFHVNYIIDKKNKYNRWLRNANIKFVINEIALNKKDIPGFIVISLISFLIYSSVFFEKTKLNIKIIEIVFCIATFYWLLAFTNQINNLNKKTLVILAPFRSIWLLKMDLLFLTPLAISLFLLSFKNYSIYETISLGIKCLLFFHYFLYRFITRNINDIIRFILLHIEMCIVLSIAYISGLLFFLIFFFVVFIQYYKFPDKITMLYRNEIYDRN